MVTAKEQLTRNFGLEEKLKLLAGGDQLPYPEIGELLTVRALKDLEVAKSGKTFAPLMVTPVIDVANKERFAKDFELVEGNQYKFFLPLIGREHVAKYMKEVNQSLENCLITIEIKEWEDCPPEKIAVNRDDQGRAKTVVITKVAAFSDNPEQAMKDVEEQIGGTK